MHIEIKGITAQAQSSTLGMNLFCGESSKYKLDGTNFKSAIFTMAKADGKQAEAYIMGDGKSDFRWERLAQSEDSYCFSGYGFENKLPVIASFNHKLENNWVLTGDSLKIIEEPAMQMDGEGNIIFGHKYVGANSYDMFFSLVNRDGIVITTNKIDHVDIIGDLMNVSDNNFMLHFLQKGAYFDGATNKKYFILPSIVIAKDGKIQRQFNFLIDRVANAEVKTYKVLEDKNKALYYFGSINPVPEVTELLIIKADENGKVLWSYAYNTGHKLEIKTANFTSKDQLIFVADAYGHEDGMLIGSINSKGDMMWNNFSKKSMFDQIRNIQINEKGFLISYDKLLNIGMMQANKQGEICSSPSSKLTISRRDVGAITGIEKAEWQTVNCTWKTAQIKAQSIGKLDWIDDCK